MIVRCKHNRVERLPTMHRQLVKTYTTLPEVHLEPGTSYLVFGISFRSGTPWYLVCEDRDATYPKPHFFGFFDVVDSAVPPRWEFKPTGEINVETPALLPAEWARDPMFLERLVDDDPKALADFQHYRDKLQEWHTRNRSGVVQGLNG